jgi:hypothetical protein
MAAQTVDAPGFFDPSLVPNQADRLGRADLEAFQASGTFGGDDLRGQDELPGDMGV